jgi:hypothetical protein
MAKLGMNPSHPNDDGTAIVLASHRRGFVPSTARLVPCATAAIAFAG